MDGDGHFLIVLAIQIFKSDESAYFILLHYIINNSTTLVLTLLPDLRVGD
jgi:hypothetical protein